MGHSERIRVGIVGAGGIAPPHVKAWLTLGAEVLLLRRGGAAELAAAHGLEVIDDLDGLLDRVDLVDILSPTATHAGIARAAITRGRHVVCEKPLAMTAAEAAGIAEAAAAAGVRLFPAHVVRYFGDYARMKDQADAGTVGDLVELKFQRTVAAPAAGWFYEADAGGGLIRDLMIHDLDQARWLAGPVVEVSARQDAGATPPLTAEVVLTHASGAVSRVSAGWLAPGTPFRSAAEITGTRAILRADTSAPVSAPADPYLAQLVDFAEALASGGPARVLPEDGVAAVALVDAALASLAAGAPARVGAG
ncbi:Gfo/Idh/MocA family protein [Microbacterium sp. SD291]|uniref:Gfo/Idh/MocA family protein n=1 Tax=Microbacterium sp. SD291 TaxID=2782007 RepID=UPI001A965E2C|nr:Gfo/Idh/MocA family oxidoreductase [Microbacterium sp. SD291]MBO0981185.1 Gfo/Idh/MocA family oxidoreductase [Microbacterium sp. SD291]